MPRQPPTTEELRKLLKELEAEVKLYNLLYADKGGNNHGSQINPK